MIRSFRKLTVSRRYHARRSGQYVACAELRLNGRWLEASGFATGQTVEVQTEPGRLVITLCARPEVLPRESSPDVLALLAQARAQLLIAWPGSRLSEKGMKWIVEKPDGQRISLLVTPLQPGQRMPATGSNRLLIVHGSHREPGFYFLPAHVPVFLLPQQIADETLPLLEVFRLRVRTVWSEQG